MKIKNINSTFLVLGCLLILSFAFYVGAEDRTNTTSSVFLDSDQDGLTNEEEKMYGTDPQKSDTDGDGYSDGAEVRAGYNPLKPAPGDKIIADTTASKIASADSVLGDSAQKNLTTDLSERLSKLTTSSDSPPSLEDVQSLIDQTIAGDNNLGETNLPEIKREDLNIKSQASYANLSEKRALEKIKEDATNYLTALIYILSSNSPEPITSLSDAPKVIQNIQNIIISAISSRNTAGIEKLAESQTKIIEQLKALEVPENLVDLHLKALNLALYSNELAQTLRPKDEDPLGDIASLAKISGLLSAFSDFTMEAQAKFSEYGLDYNETIQKKLESYGISAPESLEEIGKLLEQN
jgi:hypothetical protein